MACSPSAVAHPHPLLLTLWPRVSRWLPPTVLQLPSLLVALGLACSAFNAAHSQWVGLRQEALLLASLVRSRGGGG